MGFKLEGHGDKVTSMALVPAQFDFTVHDRPDGDTAHPMLISVSHDCTIRIWDLHIAKDYLTKPDPDLRVQPYAIQTISRAHEDHISEVAFCPEHRLFATCCSDSSARIWDWDTRELVYTLCHHTASVTCVR